MKKEKSDKFSQTKRNAKKEKRKKRKKEKKIPFEYKREPFTQNFIIALVKNIKHKIAIQPM